MAVKTVKGRNTLGTLGSLAAVAGMATGQPWLSTLGMGMGTVGNMINGNSPTLEQAGSLAEILNNISGWFNPANNNIGKVKMSDEELAKKWGGFLGTAGYNGWGL